MEDYEHRRIARMAEIDALPPAIKELVHEWGWTIVKNFLDCGVKKPKHIRHLIKVVLDETRAPRGLAASSQGVRRLQPAAKTNKGELND